MGSVQNPYVISRCGIFNGQSSDLPHYPHTKLTAHTPSLISPPSLSHVCIYSCAYSAWPPHLSPLHNTNKLYMCDNRPAGALLCIWSRVSCLSLHFSSFQSVHLSIFAALVTLAVTAEILSLPPLLRISIH